ncbi:type II secretion system F family protein [Pseudomonas syringae pv. actinidiae]|nr:type II secretion system F family protein [Pseudomonas syringae pv. actinidiae]
MAKINLLTMSAFQYRRAKMKFGSKYRLGMYEKLANFMKNGVDIDSAMEQMAEGFDHFNKNDVRSKVIGELRESLATGMTFSSALSLWAPAGEVMLIKSGERSGALANAMENACLATEAGRKMKGAMISSMAYPVILLMVLCVMIYIFSSQAVPRLVEVKDPADWPSMSKGLYVISMYVNHWWFETILGVIGWSFFNSYLLPRWTNKFRSKVEFLPPYSIYKSYQGSIFLVSLSAMMQTGIAVWDALDELKELSSDYMKHHINLMQERLLNGVNVGQALETGLLDQDIAIDLRVYASTANIEEKMGKIGESAIKSGIARIQTIGSIMNGVAIMMIGSYLIWQIIAFYMLTQGIGADAGI